MKFKHIVILFFISMGVFCSCEEEVVIIDRKPEIGIAGTYYASGVYQEIVPSVILVEEKAGCLFYEGRDSIDIDKDSINDIVLISANQYPDFNGECYECPGGPDIICDFWPTGHDYRISRILDTTYQIACDENFNIISFSCNDTIDDRHIWKNSGFLTFFNTNYFPPPSSSHGYWNYSEDKYMGIRKTGEITSYGWIRLNLSETIEIKELYLGK